MADALLVDLAEDVPAAAPASEQASALSTITSALSSVFLGSDTAPAPAAAPAPAPAPTPAPVPTPETTGSELSGMMAMPLIAQARQPAATGCGMHAGFRTSIVLGGMAGSSKTLQRVLKLAHAYAAHAKAKHNEVHLVFLGGFAPTRAWSAVEPLKQILTFLSKGCAQLKTSRRHVHSIAGPAELALLRLADRGELGEIGYFAAETPTWEVAESWQKALKNPPPLIPEEWQTYATATSIFSDMRLPEKSGDAEADAATLQKVCDMLTLCTFLKLECLLSMTMNAGFQSDAEPGFLRNVLRWRMRAADCQPFVENEALRCGPDDGGWLPASVLKFIEDDGISLNKEAQALVPVAAAALRVVKEYVDDTLVPLMHESRVVDCVEPPAGQSENMCAWLIAGGTCGSTDNVIVGKLPVSADVEDGRVHVKWEESLTGDWPAAMNKSFGSFVQQWAEGGESTPEAVAWLALSTPQCACGPLRGNPVNALAGLGEHTPASPTVGASGAVDSVLPTVSKHRAEAGGVVTGWCLRPNSLVDVDAFGLLTWCGNMKRKLRDDSLLTAREEPFDDEAQYVVDAVVLGCLKTGAFTPADMQRGMRGVVGGLVHAGRRDSEVLRVVSWEASTPVVTLLPNSFVKEALHNLHVDAPPSRSAGAVVTSLSLHDSGAIPLQIDGVTEAEADDVRSEYGGTRAWRIDGAQDAAPAMMQPAATCFRVVTTSADPLAGVAVAFAPNGQQHVTLRAL